ncbi:MAG: polysaccharide deacetylase family protein [Oscillospiraceae bacterium]|nr:polysaccharide deacetylase family protein [Oscillospiraceae bacterium]
MNRWGLLWRIFLVGILLFCGLIWLPPADVPASSDLKLEVPGPVEGKKLVALTFDDGPHPEFTGPLLEGLRERGVKATFFLVGTQIQYAPELVSRMAREGHQIGVHTYSHVSVVGLEQEEFCLQVEGTRRLIYSLLGERELWLRPPYGILDENAQHWADSPVVLWSVDPEDWKDTNVDRIREHIVSHTRDGDIVLLHDIYPTSVEAVLEAIDQLQKQGFQFVTVAQLMEERGVVPECGQIYKRLADSS